MTSVPFLYLDCENEYSTTVNLRRMTLRQYLAAAPLLGIAYAIDDHPIEWIDVNDPDWLAFVAWLHDLANDPEVVWVAHNAAFDIRDLRFGWTRKHGKISLPQPLHVQCSLEMAYGAWPNQPGAPKVSAAGDKTDKLDAHAYGLASLAKTLALGMDKLVMGKADLGDYCKRDVELCRAIHKRALPRLHPEEIALVEAAQRVRELYLEIDASKVSLAISAFDAAARSARDDAVALLGSEYADAFGVDATTGSVRSVKPHKLRAALLEKLGFDAPTTSLKKLNPQRLSEAPEAAAVLKAAGEANKVLSHRRRTAVFAGVSEVDVELGYGRAHTMRYSSPSVGKGINLHNIPKRNKVLAKAIRSMFVLPKGWCWVQADLSNVEYRMTGWVTKCGHTERLFRGNVLADPYSAFWLAATGQIIKKGMPARQVAKAAVLGLSYLMALLRWTLELMRALADPDNKLTVADFQAIADENRWTLDRYGRKVQSESHAPDAIVRVAQGTLAAFHNVHSEFRPFAEWLEGSVADASRAFDPARALDLRYALPAAPDRDRCLLTWEDSADLERSVRAYVAGWPHPTVTWRDIGVRPVGFDGGMAMSSRQAGSKGYRVLTKNILIENLGQTLGRVALVRGKRKLEARGWDYIMSIHDAVMIACPIDAAEVLRARDDLTAVFGPGNDLGFDWAAVIDPDEINVSKSLYETELGADWWTRLRAGETSLLQELT